MTMPSKHPTTTKDWMVTENGYHSHNYHDDYGIINPLQHQHNLGDVYHEHEDYHVIDVDHMIFTPPQTNASQS